MRTTGGPANPIRVVVSHRLAARARLTLLAMIAMGNHGVTVQGIRAATATRHKAIVLTRTAPHRGRAPDRVRVVATTPIRPVPTRVRLLATIRTAPLPDKVVATTIQTTTRAGTAMDHVLEVAMIKSGEPIAATYQANRKYQLTSALPTPG
jgi:hypothetical protein